MPRLPLPLCRSGNTEIDLNKGIVRKDGVETYLRAKAQDLLLYLIENRDRPVSKDELLREVWGGVLVSDATIFGCVQEIRKALGDDARNPVFIRTLAKKGYWFVGAIEPLSAQEPDALVPEPFATVTAGATRAGPFTAGDKATAASVENSTGGPKRQILRWVALAPAIGGVLATAWLLPPGATIETRYEEVAWWKFDEGAGTQIRDSVQGLAAPLPTAGVNWVPGISGTALRFNGYDTSIMGLDHGRLPHGFARDLDSALYGMKAQRDAAIYAMMRHQSEH